MKESDLIKKANEGYKQEFNEIPDNSDFLNQLKKINNEKKKPLFLLWLSKPIPAYSLALASLLFMLLFFTIQPKTTKLIVYNTPETIIQYDTIVVRDTIRIQEDFEELKSESFKKLVQNNPKQRKKRNSTPIQSVINNSEFYFDASQVSDQQNLTGSSSADSELAQFLGVSI
ncbi:hypothetical protein N9P55_00150 [bacterium]|nr:hypothetical protein [bacterium]MDB4088283.1 hypothetical protein [Flavobacteriales bacterium]